MAGSGGAGKSGAAATQSVAVVVHRLRPCTRPVDGGRDGGFALTYVSGLADNGGAATAATRGQLPRFPASERNQTYDYQECQE